MKICFYAPFKPIDHPQPSGDLVTARGIVDFLRFRGHDVVPVSSLRCRWIYWKPWLWPRLLQERQRVVRRLSGRGFDIWLSYHSYYKAPDVLGPYAADRMNLPYVLFQGVFSTKRRRSWKTLPGFHLNRKTLLATRRIFTNKQVDRRNLERLLPGERIRYVAPGIQPDDFSFDPEARQCLRRAWQAGDEPVVLAVAMFRPGVKTEGLTWVIRACGELQRRGQRLRLVIVGDGRERARLMRLAQTELSERTLFAGRVDRGELYRYYSAADLFVFPGIQESLGMVYLEAQSCGLPAVAFENAGVPEAVRNGVTGLLVPMYDDRQFVAAIERLLQDDDLRRRMGANAKAHVRQFHDIRQNYRAMETVLQEMVRR
ncbi:MAG: glycosyltransferase family 4 protein [Desulfobacterales bacterium]|jgi:glycosyltransferase involved in cell wall biosynthesis|nr:glycosyltransferase family 4 protein [Desulfobacterales bacterium]